MKSTQEEKIELLKELEGKTLTRKELDDAGITSYYLKVFIDGELIEKVKRGVYKVNLKKNEDKYRNNKMFQYFNRFKYKVLDGKYEDAYEAIMENARLQVGHDYDNHMRAYFILLKELLGNSYDFSILDELYEFTEEKNDSYYTEFIIFRECLMAGNFYEARIHLDHFMEEEQQHLGQNNISTILFNNMLDDVLKKIESNYNTQAQEEIFQESYYKLISAIKNNKFIEASKYINNCIFNSKSEKFSIKLKKMRSIINDIISLINGNNINKEKVNYDKTFNYYYKLNSAIDAKDYENALTFVEKIIEIDARYYFKLLKTLFQKIIKIQNKDKVKTEDIEVKEEKTMSSETAYQAFLYEYNHGNYEKSLGYLEIYRLRNKDKEFNANYQRLFNLLDFLISMKNNKCSFYSLDINYEDCKNAEEILYKALDNKDFKIALKNIGKVTYQNTSEILDLFKKMLHQMYEFDKLYAKKEVPSPTIEETIENKEENKISEEIEEKEEVILDDDLIINLVDNFNYDELFDLLNKKNQVEKLNRLEITVLRLLKIYYKVENNHFVYNYHNYEVSSYDSLKRMFEAIKFEDVNEAYEMANDALRFIHDTKEVELFRIILKDILDLIEEKEEEKRGEEEKNKIDKIIVSLIKDKDSLSEVELEDIKGLVDNRFNYDKENLTSIWFNILEFISLANTTNLDKDYFGGLNDCEYYEGFEDINKIPVKKRLMIYLNNGDYLNARNIIKNLEKYDRYNMFSENERYILKRLLDILINSLNKVYTYEPDLVIEDENLKTIKRYIKKYDFYGAYKYVLDNNLNDEYLNVIFPYIFEGMCLILINQYNIKKSFLEAIKNDKMDIARIEMLNYKEVLDKTSLGNLESMQETVNDMVKKLKK